MATLHSTGTAVRWLQLHESDSRSFTWEDLCKCLSEKFGCDQYQAQLRQFNMLKQTWSIAEYMGQFEELMHQILAHNPGFDPIYFATQFLDALRVEIRAGVALHRPQT